MKKSIIVLHCLSILILLVAGSWFVKTVSANSNSSLIFRVENQTINNGYYTNLNEHIDSLKSLNEGTIIVKFRYTGSTIMSLFSLSNNTLPDGHFNFYISPNAIGVENRYSAPSQPKSNTHVKMDTALSQDEIHTVAVVVDQDEGYKFFLDGALVKHDTTSARKFLNNIYAPNSAQLGRTQRSSGQNEYLFNGDIHFAEVYSEPLDDQSLIEITKPINRVVSNNVNRSFNGTSEYVDITNELSKVQNLQKGTLYAKFKMTDGANDRTLLSLSNSAADASNITLSINSGRLHFESRESSAYTSNQTYIVNYTSPTGLLYNDDRWHKVAISIDESSTVIYVDGEKLSTTTGFQFASAISGLNTFLIGANRDFKASPEWYYKGDIESVAVYDKKMDDFELKTLTSNIDSREIDLNRIKGYISTNSQPYKFVFTGDDIAFSAGQALGYRNFAQHFEERIRWELGGATIRRQNYVFNTGIKGMTSAELIADFDRLVADLQPKTVFVMLGMADANAQVPLNNFKSNLKTIVGNIRDIGAIPVLQTGIYPTDEAFRGILSPYVDIIKEVSSEDYVVLSDHYENWKTYNNLSTLVDADGNLPNELGHLSIAKELMTLFSVGGSGNTWNLNGFSDIKEPAQEHLTQEIDYTIDNNVLAVDLATTLAGIANLEKAVISLKSDTSTYTRETNNLTSVVNLINIEPNMPYVLTVKAKVANQDKYVNVNPAYIQTTPPEPAVIPSEIEVLLQGNEPLTWLFSGDSITHGAVYSYGRKSYVELFGERIRGELSELYPARAKDLVLNTGISSTTSRDLINNFDRWITANNPDVVFIAFGMNDSSNHLVPIAEYETNLRDAVDRVRELGAIPILQTINTIRPADVGRFNNLPNYVQVVRNIAADKQVLLVDHYRYWTEAEQDESHIKSTWLSDNIHPNHIGFTHFVTEIFQTLGIYDPNSYISSLRYKTQPTVDQLNVTPTIIKESNTISLNLQPIVTSAGGVNSVESVTASLSLGADDNIIVESRELDGIITFSELPETNGYTIKVKVKVKGQNKELHLNTVRGDLIEIPQSQMTATATSSQVGVNDPYMAIDNDVNTIWHTNWNTPNPLPQSIVLQLGGTYNVSQLKYLPRINAGNGTITAYNIYTSLDGVNYTLVTSGNWARNTLWQEADFSPVEAAYIKLEATAGVGNFASAAELKVFYSDVQIPSPSAGAHFTASSPVTAEEEFEVVLSLADLTEEAFAVDFTLQYDAEVMDYVLANSIASGVQLVTAEQSLEDKIRFILASSGSGYAMTGDIELIKFVFKANPTNETVSGEIELKEMILGTALGEELSIDPSSISITVQPKSIVVDLDLNGDGKISIGDLALLAAHYGYDHTHEQWDSIKRFDLNSDNVINLEDLVLLAQELL